MIKPPEGFTLLNWASNETQKTYNVIGVCVDHLEPTKSKGTDYTSQITLHDPSWFQDRGMKFRWFNSSPKFMPKVKANGDVIILRDVATKIYNHQNLGMSNYGTSWTVLCGTSILESTCPTGSDIQVIDSSSVRRCPAPSIEELLYAKDIATREDITTFQQPRRSTQLEVDNRILAAGGTPIQRNEKRKLIQDLSPNLDAKGYNFADLFGEVRKSWYNDYGRVELSLTDYTTNKLLYSYADEPTSRDGDTYGYTGGLHERWPGPWGRMTISILLYDAHASFAKSHIKPGMYVLIKNCQIKLDPHGSKLEAVCRGDREDASNVNVMIHEPRQAEHDEKFKDLLRRRLEYEKLAKEKGLRFGLDKETKKEGNKRAVNDIETVEATEGAAGANTKNKSRKKRNRGNKKQVAETTTDTGANTAVLQTNQHVRCNNISVPLKPISSILDSTILDRKTPKGTPFCLPFQNCTYKSKVRVVDYYPHDIADFSIPYLVSDYDVLGQNSSPEDTTQLALTAAQSNPNTVRWEWRFFLVVEDAGPRSVQTSSSSPSHQMALMVADQDAEYLLNTEAIDLRCNPQELGKLREKLFVLWGDLQERKEEAMALERDMGQALSPVQAQSKPFECFIKEYGVPLPVGDGHNMTDTGDVTMYQRMFRLFGTSI